MELRELTHEEKVALVGIVEFLAESERDVSDEELAQIRGIARELGPATYRKLTEEVDRRFPDEEALRSFLRGIERQDARDLIFEKALETAIPNGIHENESRLLEWLRGTWKVQVRFAES